MYDLKKNPSGRLHNQYYPGIIAIIGAVLWLTGVSYFSLPKGYLVEIALISFFFAFLTSFPINIFQMSITVNQIIFLGIGMVYGPAVAAWSAIIGVSLGMISRRLISPPRQQNSTLDSFVQILLSIWYEIGLVVNPFIIAVLVLGWQEGLNPNSIPLVVELSSAFWITLVYVIVHALLVFGAIWFQTQKPGFQLKQIIFTLSMIEILPLPFILLSVMAYPLIKIGSIGIIAGIPAILSVLLFDSNKNRADLERRLRDLSLLNEIAQVIRYSTDLDNLLEAIHVQVSGLLNVINFYVALYDSTDETIWYPLALKDNKPQNWERRPLMNRLTDRVIQENRPIMLPKEAHKELKKLNAPIGTEPLHSWLGVPLITPDRTLGCLAVFSITPDISFTEDDLNLLTTLSGQVSIALENALLLEQTGKTVTRQAEQLNILELISRQLSAALRSDDLFKLILSYALEFTESPWGSITVFNPEADTFEIKSQEGYQVETDKIPVMEGVTGRVINTGKPVIINDVSKDPDFQDVTNGQTTSEMTVPILNKDQVIGTINLESPNLNEYTQTELNFVNQLADQAALAINNAALYDKAQSSLREQATLFLISSRLAADNDLRGVLTTVAQAFSAALDSYLTGVYLWDSGKQTFLCQASMTREHDTKVELPETISRENWTDIQKRRTATGPLRITTKQRKLTKVVKLSKESQTLIFPLQIADQSIGLVINHINDDFTFTNNEMQLPNAIAAQSSIAIQNALLFSDVSKGLDRLETVLNAVGEGVLMVNASGHVTLANKPMEILTNLSVEDITNKKLSSLSDDLKKPLGLSVEEVEELSSTTQGQTKHELEPKHNYDFRDRFYERTIAPVWAANNQTLGWVIVVRDVTEERQLSQTRELLTETLVHDLRSPIGAVKTTLDLIREAIPKSERDPITDQSLDIANRSTERVLTLIDSLLDISQLESGNVDIITKPAEIHLTISETIGELIPQANEIGIVLKEGKNIDIPKVIFNKELIQRVLTNLLDNALKFTPEGGVITVDAKDNKDGYVTVRVSDTGPGIPEEYQEEVFRRFSQVPGLRGRRRGSGLGLTFCRLAIDAHGGQIWVDSNAKNIGATIAFTLPTVKTPYG